MLKMNILIFIQIPNPVSIIFTREATLLSFNFLLYFRIINMMQNKS